MSTNANSSSAASSESFKEIKIPVPWGHVSGKWWGKMDRRPVLALHGWQDNAGTFDGLAPLMVDHNLPVLCIDLPGHGLSSPLPNGMYYYIFWDGLILIRRIVKHFKWSKVTLMGHSLGGAISFMYAASYPDEVDKVIQLDIASPAVNSYHDKLHLVGEGIDKFLKYERLGKCEQPRYPYDEMIDTVVQAHFGHCTREACEMLMKRGMTPVKKQAEQSSNSFPIGNGSHFEQTSKSSGGSNNVEGSTKETATKKINVDDICDGALTGAKANSDATYYEYNRDLRLKAVGLGMLNIHDALLFAARIKCKWMNIKATTTRKDIDKKYYDLVLDIIRVNAEVLRVHEVEGMHHLHLNNPESIIDFVVDFLKNC